MECPQTLTIVCTKLFCNNRPSPWSMRYKRWSGGIRTRSTSLPQTT